MNSFLLRHILALKVVLFLSALLPAAWLTAGVFGAFAADLGANPVEKLIHETGIWALRFLLITLAVTPWRSITGWNALIRLRRMLGLFAFFYVVLHFTCYALIDQRLAFGPILEDIAERPFITIGVTALVLLIPLALTSTNAMMRRLGRRWKKLHRLVYVIAILGVWHFYWQEKKDVLEALIYAGILAVLLGWRLYDFLRRNRTLATSAAK